MLLVPTTYACDASELAKPGEPAGGTSRGTSGVTTAPGKTNTLLRGADVSARKRRPDSVRAAYVRDGYTLRSRRWIAPNGTSEIWGDVAPAGARLVSPKASSTES